MLAYVEAPNFELYLHWLAKGQRRAFDYPLLKDFRDLNGYYGSIIVLNGGSLDAHIRSQVNHPSRRAGITHMEV